MESWRIDRDAGRTSLNKILLNQSLDRITRIKTFRHELAHLFLSRVCSTSIGQSQLVQESFALLESGDFRDHPGGAKNFPTSATAINFLRTHQLKQRPGDRKYVQAISRILNAAAIRKELHRRFEFLIQSRELCQRSAERIESDIWSVLSREEEVIKRGPLEFVVLDRLSGELIASSGSIEKAQKVTSVLKPIVLAVFPEVMPSRVSRSKITWACPTMKSAADLRAYTWVEGLAYSCNGFFLDANLPRSEWSRWDNYFQSYGLPRRRSQVQSMNEAIGLTERVEISLLELARIYRELSFSHSQIIEALESVFTYGTLSQSADAAYYRKLGARLKSGTARTPQGVPTRAWLAGQIGNLILVATQEGAAAVDLLKPLKARLGEWGKISINPARVQILGLLPEVLVDFHCEKTALLLNDRPIKNFRLTDLQRGDRLRCLSGPLLAKVPRNNGKVIHRPYWGTLTYSAPNSGADLRTSSSTEKQARARRGSHFILETSERSYVARVLASEMSQGRRETLKALAYVVRQNLHSGRHSERPICDTTHCQVFSLNENLNHRRLQKYFSAFDAIAAKPIEEARFLNFSLGGEEPWVRKRSLTQVAKALETHQTDFELVADAEDEFLRFGNEKVNCERLRSALKLLSCPEEIKKEGKHFVFSGRGEGHGLGLDLKKAEAMAASGESYEKILHNFFR